MYNYIPENNETWSPYFALHLKLVLLTFARRIIIEICFHTTFCTTSLSGHIYIGGVSSSTTAGGPSDDQEQAGWQPGTGWWQLDRQLTIWKDSYSQSVRAGSPDWSQSHTERYPQGLPRGMEDERPNDDLMTNRTTTRTTPICWCGRTFNTVHGMRIHQTKKACWSIQRSPDSDAKDSCGGIPIPGEPCKAEGTASEDNPPIADGHADDPSLEESAARVKWPATSDKAAWKQLDEDLSKVLTGAFKAGSLRCLASFGKIVYQYCKERFGALEQTNKESRRQAEIREVRAQLRQLKKAWKAASQQRKPEIDILRNQIREVLFTLRRAEASRKGRKERERKRKAFFENPHRFTKKLFEAARSGRLTVFQGELETHLKRLYSDPQREEEMEPMPGLKRPTHPGIQFDTAEPRLKEVTAFLKKSRAVPHQDPTESRTRCIKPAIKCDNFSGRCYDWHGGAR